MAVRRLDETRRHARDLTPAVAELLAGAGWRPRDLEGVIVGVGPGSYTGLRVGVMSAKALAFATGCALLAVPTFDVIARQAPAESGTLHVLADAQQDKIYVQPFARGAADNQMKASGPLEIQAAADWLGRLTAGDWVAGAGLRKHRAALPAGVNVVAEEHWPPGAAALLEIGLGRYGRGERDDVLA